MLTMQAIRFHQYGAPDVLRLEQAPKPVAGDGQALVKIHATGVNPVDGAIRSGRLKGIRDVELPATPGWEFSGVIEGVGSNAGDWKAGDEVFGYQPLGSPGTYAEYVTVDASICVRKPMSIDHEHAAAIPLAGLTAWQALFDHAGLTAGQKVLIHAGAGGVGSFAIQFAKARFGPEGALKVAATASTRNQEFLKQLGADQPIDYTTTNFEDVVNDADAVIESMGGETRDRSWQCLKKGGILVALIGPPPSQEAADAHGVRQTLMWLAPNAAQLGEIAGLVDSGKVKVHLETILPLAEAAKAQELSAAGRTRGKIVLKVV